MTAIPIPMHNKNIRAGRVRKPLSSPWSGLVR